MRLVQAVPHETIPTLAHKTFECPACHDVEQRLMLSGEPTDGPAELVPIHEAPPTAQELEPAHEAPPTAQESPADNTAEADHVAEADQALWRNAWAMLRGRQSRH
jgi:hypothetical protein